MTELDVFLFGQLELDVLDDWIDVYYMFIAAFTVLEIQVIVQSPNCHYISFYFWFKLSHIKLLAVIGAEFNCRSVFGKACGFSLFKSGKSLKQTIEIDSPIMMYADDSTQGQFQLAHVVQGYAKIAGWDANKSNLVLIFSRNVSATMKQLLHGCKVLVLLGKIPGIVVYNKAGKSRRCHLGMVCIGIISLHTIFYRNKQGLLCDGKIILS